MTYLVAFLASLFSCGLGLLTPVFSMVFLIPLYRLFLQESKLLLFVMIFLFSVFLDIQEGFFPVNCILLNGVFILFFMQRVLPYQQERLFFYLGFSILLFSFVFLKSVSLNLFFQIPFSSSVLLDFIVTLFVYVLVEFVIVYCFSKQEKKIRAKR